MKYKKSASKLKKELQSLVDVTELIRQGMGVRAASDEVGITPETYRNLKKRYESSDFDKLAAEHGFLDWNHGWLKLDGASIHIKNNTPEVSYTEIRNEQVEAMKKYAPKYKEIKRDKIKDGHLLIIDPADIHVGKLSVAIETGEEYNVKIAIRRAIDGVEGIIQKASGFPVDKVVLVIGNDVLHIDSPHRKTTAGTPQDTDGMWHESYIRARELYVQIIERLMTVADVQVIYNPSNHDYQSGFMLADAISCWFHNCPNVKFDTSIRHRKYFVYGESLIGTSHGDGAREGDLSKLMAHEAKDMWAKVSHCYWYLHHKHHKIAKDDIGVTIEYLRTPSAPDGWHDRNGYKNKQAVEGFVHHKTQGQLARLTHYFNVKS